MSLSNGLDFRVSRSEFRVSGFEFRVQLERREVIRGAMARWCNSSLPSDAGAFLVAAVFEVQGLGFRSKGLVLSVQGSVLSVFG